ncbi:PglL family O-oligosaccharyltransferase [Klebsiella aerogenes]|uniref:PglL family O-oligosaccharyltransferase n=1 Tax=Klebsiella aerogenes TaxID=548 RepID=UPI00254CC9A0|nr:O-antigen ligase family protein [Klebsiella aerogenes]MDK7100070.1 Wzy polymerase domain-containing protein [Klebsiella aerogenes]MDK7645559.1 Wzy polymerase domain-containing protein [Klebsiella aerogenes]MDK7850442.1 Wzy polymerase domain-containing protein [Klebsiella aerogenes]MDK8313049.1 Wzy polymerase domain-containing protein [Klebsiella aerogenes]
MVTTINLAIIIFASATSFLYWLKKPVHGTTIAITPSYILFCAGVFILSVPLLWTPANWISTAVMRSACLVAGCGFLLIIMQLKHSHLVVGLYLVTLASSVQAIFACQQLMIPQSPWFPLYSDRLYGSFFQPNLLASYLATGIAVSWALLLPFFCLRSPGYERWRRSGLLIAIILQSAVLVLTQSRTGFLGIVCVVIFFSCLQWKTSSSTVVRGVLAVISGLILGGLFLLHGEDYIELRTGHHSNLARWSMLKDTLSMILEKPVSGWGYGGFEFSFQHFRVNQSVPTIVTEITRHPHNEILYWLAEGGLIALCGMLLIIYGLSKIATGIFRFENRSVISDGSSKGISLSIGVALVPVIIHTQLEYPLYISALHCVTFVFLLGFVTQCSQNIIPIKQISVIYSIKLFCIIKAFSVMFIFGFALYGHIVLSDAENFRMEDMTTVNTLPEPVQWILSERVNFDKNVNILLRYNSTHDEALLYEYRLWAEDYLERRIDQNVYANLISILHHQKRFAEYNFYLREASAFFPRDARFDVGTFHDGKHL